MFLERFTNWRAAAALFSCAAALAACGGGGGGAPAGGAPPVVPTQPPITSAPNPTPTPTPYQTPPTITVSPSNVLSFYDVGAMYSSQVTVAEASYAGGFTPSAQCNGIVSVTAGSNNVFTVTPLSAGNCIFSFKDANGNTGPGMYVSVTMTQVIGSGASRR